MPNKLQVPDISNWIKVPTKNPLYPGGFEYINPDNPNQRMIPIGIRPPSALQTSLEGASEGNVPQFPVAANQQVQAVRCGMMRAMGAGPGMLVQAKCFPSIAPPVTPPVTAPTMPPPGAVPTTPPVTAPPLATAPYVGEPAMPSPIPFGSQGGYGRRRNPLEEALRRLQGGM